jgi:hypothetical protein
MFPGYFSGHCAFLLKSGCAGASLRVDALACFDQERSHAAKLQLQLIRAGEPITSQHHQQHCDQQHGYHWRRPLCWHALGCQPGQLYSVAQHCCSTGRGPRLHGLRHNTSCEHFQVQPSSGGVILHVPERCRGELGSPQACTNRLQKLPTKLFSLNHGTWSLQSFQDACLTHLFVVCRMSLPGWM